MRETSLAESMPPVTKNLLIINGIMWLACVIFEYTDSRVDLMGMLGMHFFLAEWFMPHQMVTYMFLHSIGFGGGISFSHLFFNMFAVFVFGMAIEAMWGSRRFLGYYLLTGVGAGIVQQVVWYLTIPSVYYTDAAEMAVLNSLLTVGASGAVFGILLAFGVMFPNVKMFLLFVPIGIKAKYLVVGYGLLELGLGVLNRPGDSVAHFAHLGGMVFGLVMVLYWKRKGRLYGGRFK